MTDTANKADVKILLLEGVSQKAIDFLAQNGYTNIEYHKGAMPEEELVEKIRDVHFLGIRSRTQVNAKVLESAQQLMAVGCFCIGTNQVDLETAKRLGVPVFNAPFANTRSVAELTIASTIHLMRGIHSKNLAAHRGEWHKSAENSYEVRGKKLGIVGYGNIGSQLSVIASGLGMHVYYYDTSKKLPHGNARSTSSLEELLSLCDVVTLHVPETPQTKMMMNADTLAKMKPGSFLINYARGSVVDIDALKEKLDSGHILGAALDVFPVEPKSKDEQFQSPLRGMDQVLVSPHVGGSTQEAQENIGLEVADKLITYADNGSTAWAVNFPEASLPAHSSSHRILNIHQNTPGIMSQINGVIAEQGANVVSQFLQTDPEVGYVVIDVDGEHDPQVFKAAFEAIEGSIKTRVLY